MFGSHTRTRSLISVKTIVYHDEKEHYNDDTTDGPNLSDQKTSGQHRQRRSQLTLVYLLFLAESIMASALSSQTSLLVESTVSCSSLNTLFLQSLLECAYVFGGTCGLFWGAAADRFGRRPIALLGLAGMITCCFSMGFVKSLFGYMVSRFLAGSIGAAVFTSGLAMLADVSIDSAEKTSNVANLPLVSICGVVGSMLQSLVKQLEQATSGGISKQWPALSGQIACASLIIVIAIPEALCLEETLHKRCTAASDTKSDPDSEKATLLNSKGFDGTDYALSMTIVKTDAEPAAISMSTFLQAPSFVILLASVSILSLHSSTFSVLLPHLGYTSTNSGGNGMPCEWLNIVALAAKACAAVALQLYLPRLVAKNEVLGLFRRSSIAFPLLYTVIPVLAIFATICGTPPAIWVAFGAVAVLAKEMFTGAAQVLAILLVFSAAPQADSTGTSIGLFALSNLFKSLAVGGSGLGYYLSDAYSMTAVNTMLWTALALVACVGCGINWGLRKSPIIGRDFPEDTLSWKSVFDAERDLEEGA